jgi:hypothetical protein
MKKCNDCEIEKEESNFNWRNKSKGKLSNICKACTKIKRDIWRSNNRKKYISQIKRRRDKWLKELQDRVADYLSNNPCVDCNFSDIRALDFDHIDPSTKKIEISKAIYRGWSWKKMINEINKCEVRCANCHRIKTSKQNNFIKEKYISK